MISNNIFSSKASTWSIYWSNDESICIYELRFEMEKEPVQKRNLELDLIWSDLVLNQRCKIEPGIIWDAITKPDLFFHQPIFQRNHCTWTVHLVVRFANISNYKILWYYERLLRFNKRRLWRKKYPENWTSGL